MGALNFVTPLKSEGPCNEGKGVYRRIINTRESQAVVARVQTDVDPDPNNWYPTERNVTLEPGQARVLECSHVDMGEGQGEDKVSYAILSVDFK